MRTNRSAIAGIVVGLGVGLVLGLGISVGIKVTPDRWWALAGSLLGAIVAIAGSIFAIHYEADQSETAERRRLADQIDGTLKLVADVHAAAKVVPPRYTDMRSAMRQIASEHQHLWTAMQKLKHTSAEIARASKFIIQGHADQVNMLAGRNQHDTWNNDTVKHVSALQKQLERARAELRV